MKTFDLSSIDPFLNSSIYREMKRMEEARCSWIKNLQPINTLSEQLRLITESTSAAKMIEELQRAERQQRGSIGAMLDPIADIRKNLIDVVRSQFIARILGGGINLSRGGGSDESEKEIEICT